MNNEFQEKLHLYKEGKLTPKEMIEIEEEIDRFIAIQDYLDNDEKKFFEELKQQIPIQQKEKNKNTRIIKRKVNLRILTLTTITGLCIGTLIIALYILASNITTSLFELDHKEAYVERATIVQLTEIFHPQYDSHRSGVQKLPFAKQNFVVSLQNFLGNTLIDESSISIRYNFGKPKKLQGSTKELQLLPIDDPSWIDNPEYSLLSGFDPLQNAPSGTKAKIFVGFNRALTPQQIKKNFMNPLNIDFNDITPLVTIDSKYIIANASYYQFTPVFPYDANNAEQLEDKPLKLSQYENMDNQAHQESLIGNLNLIKNNKRLLQIMYYQDMFEDINIDAIINQVENEGVEYIGMYISADSKELLKLKDNPYIHFITVENIVIW
ncbi:anti sigma factor C-terminal domain-containing protein [Clostridium sp. D2Q-11]|uniref:Anti sigma factor C-terminal domain-containing protein n=1 Tax=Anaeromonas frigoriresistens TaxID=2683708 RepID=A0A942V029_9FIRM|nr:anti sigma factor C-terminal domain-containing protein [Anaeromonas frigoriresistens]MBS4539431.1 anti sigma factor C-terminal domain-containing protein [Anaeromonas frigoriresistens]